MNKFYQTLLNMSPTFKNCSYVISGGRKEYLSDFQLR